MRRRHSILPDVMEHYIHLSAEYKLPILPLQTILNTLK
jgi:hypothetical protein